MNTHLSFQLRRDALIDSILIPKFYDPEIDASIEIASKEFELPLLGDLLLPGDAGSRLGDWIPRENYGSGSIPYVRTSDLSHWRLRPDFKKGVSDEVYEKYRVAQDVQVGDILFVAHGTYLVGEVAIVSPEDEKIVLQDHIFRLRVKSDVPGLNHLLLAALSTKFVKRQVRSRQFSADIIDKIGNRHLGIRVPIPRDEKAKIDVISEVTDLISEQSQIRSSIQQVSKSNLRMTRERAQARYGFSILRSDIKRRIFIPKYYDPQLDLDLRTEQKEDPIPWLTIGELVEKNLISVSTGVEVGKMAYGTGTFPFIRTSDIADWEVKKEIRQSVSEEIYDEYKGKASLRHEDILLVRDGTYLVGSSALVDESDIPSLFCGGLYRIRARDRSELSPHVLLAMLNLPIVRRQMRARQFTRDVIDTLGNRFLEVKVPSPYGHHTLKLADKVRTIMRKKAQIKSRIKGIVETLEPPIPAVARNRPAWSMR